MAHVASLLPTSAGQVQPHARTSAPSNITNALRPNLNALLDLDIDALTV